MFCSFPDGVGGNKLVVTFYALSAPRLLIWEGVCWCHCLSLTVNHSIDAVKLINPEYSLDCTLKLASNSSQLLQSTLGLDLRVHRGVPPPARHDSGDFGDLVLKHTVMRRPLVQSMLAAVYHIAGEERDEQAVVV